MRPFRALLLFTLATVLVAGVSLSAPAHSTEAQSPYLILIPSGGPPGTNTQAQGSGFAPGETIQIRWDHGLPAAVTLIQATASPGGGLLVSFNAPSAAPGPHTVAAVGNQSQTTVTATFLLQGTGPTPTVTSATTVPPSCSNPTATTAPPSVIPGGQVTFNATGFAPGAQVDLSIIGPGASATARTTADHSCRISALISVGATDPPGLYTVTAIGPSGAPGGGAGPVGIAPGCCGGQQQIQVQAYYTVSGLAPTPTPFFQPTATLAPTGSCPIPQATMPVSRLEPGQNATFGAVGFRPGSLVQVQIEDPSGPFAVPFFGETQVGPATTNCSVSSLFTLNTNVPVGRYRLTLTGPNHLGSQVTARVDFQVVTDASQQPTAPTPTPAAGTAPPGQPTTAPPDQPTTLPPGQTAAPPGQDGPPAPIDFQQTLTIISGANPPEVGQTSRIEHVSTITNTSAQAMTREEVLEALATLFAAAIQGQGINVRYTTDYTGDVQVVSASANIGNAAVQGNSVVWDGQLAAGQSVELRTTFDQTPTTALTINQPIQGQSLVVSDFQGISMSVPPLPPPELPPSQRVVQPPRPQVDPTTGSRFFGSTGFSVTNDAIWVFYHRRGGARTFGPPISRELLLMGSPVQLFERGMLRVGEEDSVSIVNMLEAPFLPYEALAADLILPRVEGELIDTAPDPTAENFGTTSQDFVRRHTADSFEDRPTRFYASFMSAVLFRDAFWDGQGDPNLIPGFNLEFWGLPTSRAQYLVVGQELVQVGTTPEGDPLFGTRDIVDQNTVLQRYQRGVMRHDAVAGRPTILDLGTYLRAVLLGDESFADLAAVAAGSPLWAQYNSEEPAWVARPDELPDTNLELAFEPEQ